MSEQPSLQGDSPRPLLKARRRPPEPQGFFHRMPVSVRYGLPLAAVAVLMIVFWQQIQDVLRGLLPGYAQLRVLNEEGEPLKHVRLQFFAVDTTPYGPSPTRMLSETELDADESGIVEIGPEHMPDEAFVRVSAAGYGVDYRLLQRSKKKVRTLTLGKPMQLSGIVRSVSGQPLEGARVQVLGGGVSRGPLLREIVTDKAGTFTIPDLSDRINQMQVRVLKEGYGVAEKTWKQLPTHRPPLEEEKEMTRLDFELRSVPPAKGRVLLPEGLMPKDLEIRVYQLPGVSAKVREDGSFTLHYLAKEDATIFRLLVGNLPHGYTHPLTLVRPGQDDIQIPILEAVTVTGNVLIAGSSRPVTAGLVSHENGPRGGDQCRLGKNGDFRLELVPPGETELRVTIDKSREFKEGGLRLKTVRIEDQQSQKPLVLWIR